MPSTESSAEDLQDAAALWSVSAVRGTTVVAAACDALVAGLDSPALRRLAACFQHEADYDVPEILPMALDELGLVHYPLGSRAGEGAAVRALAYQHLVGKVTARELASEIHRHFGHRVPLGERLAELDDEYDMLEYAGRTAEQVDADVTAETRLLASHRRVSAAEAIGSPTRVRTLPVRPRV